MEKKKLTMSGFVVCPVFVKEPFMLMCTTIIKELALRPIRSYNWDVCLYVYVYVPFQCNFFQGLSLALRSHDQFKASHWSTLLPHPPSNPTPPPLPPPPLNISSHLGIHKQSNACWSLPR